MTSVHPFQQYHNLAQHILDHGVRQATRTGEFTRAIAGAEFTFDVSQYYPAITSKKLSFKSVRGELWGFLRGLTNAQEFADLGCKVWFDNANNEGSRPNPWLSSIYRKGQDDLGRLGYSSQWTDWEDMRIAQSAEEANYLEKRGYYKVGDAYDSSFGIYKSSLNQLDKALHTLMTNPYDRRIIVSGWRPDQFDMMALPPCHILYQFIAHPSTKELHLCMYQRSCDLFLGIPFNIASCAMLLNMVAKLIGYTPKTFKHFMADVHIYENHVEPMRLLLSQELKPLPTLALGPSIQPLSDVSEIPGVWHRMNHEDVTMVGYPEDVISIPAPMAI